MIIYESQRLILTNMELKKDVAENTISPNTLAAVSTA